MSYGVAMGFIPMEEKDVLSFTRKVCDKLLEKPNAEHLIRSTFHYFPSQIHAFEKVDYMRLTDADEYYLYDLFNIKFVYFKYHKLLAIVGNVYSDEIQEMFKTFIYFQNSTDQDYDLDCWKGTPLFEDIITGMYRSYLSKSDFIARDKKWAEFFEEGGDIEYARRSVVYEIICNTLGIETWLYSKSGADYYTFRMNALNGEEEAMKLRSIARQTLKRAQEDFWIE